MANFMKQTVVFVFVLFIANASHATTVNVSSLKCDAYENKSVVSLKSPTFVGEPPLLTEHNFFYAPDTCNEEVLHELRMRAANFYNHLNAEIQTISREGYTRPPFGGECKHLLIEYLTLKVKFPSLQIGDKPILVEFQSTGVKVLDTYDCG